MSWHPDDIGDLSGNRAVVTGATSGLGYHTSLELLRHGAEVVLAVRDTARGSATATELARETGQDRPVVLELDLADLTSVRSATGAWPTLYAATAPGLSGGSYAGPGFFEWRGRPKLTGSSRVSHDPELARQLWEWSEEATGVSYL